ncbi:MAG: TIGR04149 family rSAM-modified RiPP [Bacteroidales bacterium]|jgi:natural product precursor|nr:TIGR04149 family rSAM-modified RiPP [Bacteroidales bacterium]
MKTLKLNKLNPNKISAEKANEIRGGAGNCGCGCAGPSGVCDNATANWNSGLTSPGVSRDTRSTSLAEFLFWRHGKEC